MTYRAGFRDLAPSVHCDHDGCNAALEAVEARGGGPPAWLRNGTAPKGWQLMYLGQNRRRWDLCPKHVTRTIRKRRA